MIPFPNNKFLYCVSEYQESNTPQHYVFHTTLFFVVLSFKAVVGLSVSAINFGVPEYCHFLMLFLSQTTMLYNKKIGLIKKLGRLISGRSALI